jgi:hypothetical protein
MGLGQRFNKSRLLLGGPSRVSHQAAKVPAVEMGILVGHDIGKTGAAGGLRPMLKAVIQGLQEVFRELRRIRISRLDGASLGVGEFVMAEPHQIHHDPFGGKRDDRMQMRGNPRRRVECDREPDLLDIAIRNAVAACDAGAARRG